MDTLLDLLDDAFARFADRPAVGMWHDDGTRTTWTYRELDRRSRLAAWRLRARPGPPAGRPDPDLVARPTPELPAVYFGAMRAGLILVPLDLRMSADAIAGIVAPRRAAPPDPRHRAGRARPGRRAGSADFPTTTVEDLVGRARTTTVPGRLGGAGRRPGRARDPTTSGT